jgi:hypothetical protein
MEQQDVDIANDGGTGRYRTALAEQADEYLPQMYIDC